MSYDGLFKRRVYEKRIPDFVKFEEDMMRQCRGGEIPIGYTRDRLVKHDFDAISHIIPAGMTDMGKSNVLKLIITSLVRNQPENTKLFLIDLKGGLSFNRYRFLNQVESIAKNPEEALETLRELQTKLNDRNEYLLEKGYEDIKEAGNPTRYFVIVDEAADMAPYQECKDIIVDIRSLRQGAALYSMRAAQRVKGRAIYQMNEKKVLQTVYINNKKIDNIIMPHINIRARKEHEDAKVSYKGSKNRVHTLELEEVGVLK